MFDFSHLLFDKLIVHRVGNYALEEGVSLSAKEHDLMDDQLQVVLFDFFFSHFKKEGLYRFKKNASIKPAIDTVFNDADFFIEGSNRIADLLYKKSTHPKIKGGELYVSLFRDVLFEDELIDAIGIFKTDQKNTFIDIHNHGSDATIGYYTGIDVSKLNKGVLIFNTLADDGYVIKVIDKLSKGTDEAKFWKDDFLELEPLKDSVYHTKTYMQLAKDFVEETMACKPEIGKKKSIETLDKAVEYFGQNDDFNLEVFAETVFEEPEIQQLFAKKAEETVGEVSFEISPNTVKSTKKIFKPVITLDNSIKITLNPNHQTRNNQVIERGYDASKGQYFYKLFYEFES